jgi:small-conductance mechanosensitive channel
MCTVRATTRTRHSLIAALSFVVLLPGLALAQADQGTQQPVVLAPQVTPAAEPVPVRIGGDPVIFIPVGLGGFSAEQRAASIEETLARVMNDESVAGLPVRIQEVDNTTQLFIGDYRIATVTEPDAQAIGVARGLIAAEWARFIEDALAVERERYSPEALIRGAIAAGIATLMLVGMLWVWRRLSGIVRKAMRVRLHRNLARFKAHHIDPKSVRTIQLLGEQTISVASVVILLLLLDIYLTFVLGQFPWTRGVATALLDMLLNPVTVGVGAVLGYLPSAFFLVFISFVILYAVRFTKVFFDAIDDGRISFPAFPADWADPTFKSVRMVIIAFGLVVAFPYLPGSSSPAFTGVSVFAGVLLSLASSSSLSNMIAGLVLTYANAYKVGDRVQVGGTVGDVIDRGLLATRVRTIKNEDVVVPNSVVLGGQIVNYSAIVEDHGLILHSTVTIGYDAPWRQIHELLISAGKATKGVADTPEPFVLQTGLNDFYVSYQLNVYVTTATGIAQVYSDLHANIQDMFNEAGVEIMSPHYSTMRDGNTIAIPESYRPKGYEAPPFKIAGRIEGPGTKGGAS